MHEAIEIDRFAIVVVMESILMISCGHQSLRGIRHGLSVVAWSVAIFLVASDVAMRAADLVASESNPSPDGGKKRRSEKPRREAIAAITNPPPWIVMGKSPKSGFGESVAAGGDINGDGFDDVIVGAPLADDGRGRIFVYYGGPNGLKTEPDFEESGDVGVQSFGSTLAFAGDVDGDGFDDVLVRSIVPGVGGPDYNISLHSGGPQGLSRVPRWQPLHEQLGFQHFWKAVGAGDLNGDGYADCAVVAQSGRNTLPPQEVVLVFYGSDTGLGAKPGSILTAEMQDSMYGFSLASAGDTNGDGFDELIVGANGYSGRYPKGGKAYIYQGTSGGILVKPSWTASYDLPVLPGVDDPSFQEFGSSVACAGDLNQDGFADVVVGAPFAERGDRDEGMLFVYLGSPSGLSIDAAAVIESNQRDTLLGWSVSGVGDVDGDGFDDFIAGAPQAAQNRINEGGGIAFYGGPSIRGLRPGWSRLCGNANEFLGRTVCGAGDVNGDGYSDVLMATSQYSHGAVNLGRVLVEYGSSNGLPSTSAWSINKPWLATAQERLEYGKARLGSIVYWGPPVLLFGTVCLGLIWGQRRLRRRMKALLAENRELTLATERARIARDIHDHLGADVTQLVFWADKAQSVTGQPAATSNSLAEISNSARRVVDTIGELVWATDPAHDTIESFINYIAEFARETLRPHGLDCRLDLPQQRVEGMLSANVRHNLFLILKELLHNVVKHAQASRVDIAIQVQGAQLRLSVRDNGIGFAMPDWLIKASTPARCTDYPVREASAGRGLRNLIERAKEVQGELISEPVQPHGAQITIVVPWNRTSL